VVEEGAQRRSETSTTEAPGLGGLVTVAARSPRRPGGRGRRTAEL